MAENSLLDLLVETYVWLKNILVEQILVEKNVSWTKIFVNGMFQ